MIDIYEEQYTELAQNLNNSVEINAFNVFIQVPLETLDEEIPETWPDRIRKEQDPAYPEDPEQTIDVIRTFKEYTLSYETVDCLIFVGHTQPGSKNRKSPTSSEELYRWLNYFGVNALKEHIGKCVAYNTGVFWAHVNATGKAGTTFLIEDDGKLALPHDGTGTANIVIDLRIGKEVTDSIVPSLIGQTKNLLIRFTKQSGGYLNMVERLINGHCSFEFTPDGFEPEQYMLEKDFQTIDETIVKLVGELYIDIYTNSSEVKSVPWHNRIK